MGVTHRGNCDVMQNGHHLGCRFRQILLEFSFIELAGVETKPYVFFLEIKTILYLNFAVLGTVSICF